MRRLLLLLLILPPAAAPSQPAPCRYAVVRVRAQGATGSATVIATGPGRTLLLTCAHVVAQGGKIDLDAPAPVGGPPVRDARPRVLAIDREADLALIVMDAGPLPYVCPVAPPGSVHSKQCLSVGYDDARLPPVYRAAEILRTDGRRTYTRERPWHGRSGGALIDERNGWLVGVVSGYTGPTARDRGGFPEVHPQGQGLYGSHAAIVRLLSSAGVAGR